MPIGILVGILVLLCLLGLFFLSEDDHLSTRRITIVFLPIVSLIAWLVLASFCEEVVLKSDLYEVETSREGYQFITVDTKPINITAIFKRMLPEGSMVRIKTPKQFYLGIFFSKEKTFHIEESN